MKIQEGIRWALAFAWLALFFNFFREGEAKADFGREKNRKCPRGVFSLCRSFFDEDLNFLGEGFVKIFPLTTPGLNRKKAQWMEVLRGQGEGPRGVREKERICGRDLFLLSGLLPVFLFWSPLFWILAASMGLRYYASIYLLKTQASREKKIVESQISDLLTGLVLSLRAGMLLDAAWMELSQNKEGPLYEEMRRVSRMRKEGVGFNQAYLSFGGRYQLDVLKDFSQLIIQNVELGGSELARGMDQLRRKETREKINRLNKEADRAQEQMLLPSLLQFIGILLLLIVPLFGQNRFYI